MSDSTSRLERAFERFDAINAEDPRTERVDGREEPKELVYARRMTQTLARFEPEASEVLRLAARAQHIARWRIPRDSFPEGRKGYKQWRTRLMQLHAELATGVLREVGYDDATVERVGRLLRKLGLRRDPEVQTLEDVACLVFLEHHFDAFAEAHEDDKLVDIVRKTWGKMSERGRQAALALDLGERATRVVTRALSDPPTATEPGSVVVTEDVSSGEAPAEDAVHRPRVVIAYCTQCRFLLRAAWLAQELLTTFADALGEVALRPATGGVFEITVDGHVLFSRKQEKRFPEAKEVKQRLRDRIAPDRDLGHSDRRDDAETG
jgi:selT/selW/selH-like putative selenoprotein